MNVLVDPEEVCRVEFSLQLRQARIVLAKGRTDRVVAFLAEEVEELAAAGIGRQRIRQAARPRNMRVRLGRIGPLRHDPDVVLRSTSSPARSAS